MAYQIRYLCDTPWHLDTVTGWIYREFVEDIRQGVTRDDVRRKLARCERSGLPLRLVAVDGIACLGTASLVRQDLRERPYTPWLASLYVDPRHRGRGVAKALIARIAARAGQLGYEELYLRTEHAGSYYEKLGWEHFEWLVEGRSGLETDIYRIELAGWSPQ